MTSFQVVLKLHPFHIRNNLFLVIKLILLDLKRVCYTISSLLFENVYFSHIPLTVIPHQRKKEREI